jgi:hypothetical protein
VVTAGLARPGWVLFAGLSWRVVVVRVSGWCARRAIVVAGQVLFVSGRCAGWAVVLVLRPVVHVSRRRARRAVIIMLGSVIVLVLALLSVCSVLLMAVCRVLLMAVGEARRDVPCIRAGLAWRGVIATAEG